MSMSNIVTTTYGPFVPPYCGHTAVDCRCTQPPPPPHEHRFTFLRQKEEKLYYGTGRIREIKRIDIFFCEGCLEYKRVQA